MQEAEITTTNDNEKNYVESLDIKDTIRNYLYLYNAITESRKQLNVNLKQQEAYKAAIINYMVKNNSGRIDVKNGTTIICQEKSLKIRPNKEQIQVAMAEYLKDTGVDVTELINFITSFAGCKKVHKLYCHVKKSEQMHPPIKNSAQ